MIKTPNVHQDKEHNSPHAGKKADSEGKEDRVKNVVRDTETENRENSKGIVSQESRNLRNTKLFPDRSL